MARSEEPQITSPYLDRPLLPLAVALPRMLEKVAVKLPRQPRNGFDLCWRSRREALRSHPRSAPERSCQSIDWTGTLDSIEVRHSRTSASGASRPLPRIPAKVPD